MKSISILLQAAMIAACCVLSGWRLLHYFQLESYQLPGYARSVRRNMTRAVMPTVAVAAAGVGATVLHAMVIVRLALIFSLSTVLFLQAGREKAKKPFVVT